MSCKYEPSAKNQVRAEFLRDSIARAEFLRDSIARAEFLRDSVERAEVIKRLSPSFIEKSDEFSDIVWIKPKSAPSYVNQNGVYCYFGKKKDSGTVLRNFRFVYQYYADDWLFIRNMIFNIDGENVTITPKMERDNESGKIWEWCDACVVYGDEGLNGDFIRKLANAKAVKVKMNGSKYYDTRTLTQAQIKAIRDAYDYYVAMGGTFE